MGMHTRVTVQRTKLGQVALGVGMGSIGPHVPAASQPRVPIGNVGQRARAFVMPVLDVAHTKPIGTPHCCTSFGVWRSSHRVHAPQEDCSLCIDHSLIFLQDFYLTNFVALRNHLLSGRDNIYIPHEGFWTKFCFWLHVSVPVSCTPPNFNAAAMSNRAEFVLLRLCYHTSYFNSSKFPFPYFPCKIQCTFGKKQKGHLLSI